MRHTGSDWKRSRRLNYSTLETGKELVKRSYGPGQHGQSRRRKQSEYGKQLIEKQKLRFTYGVNERQFQRLFRLALKSSEVTGLAFIQILESRLDNLVYRMGLARTRKGARQLVNHGHVTVNGKKVDLPSYLCAVGDKIGLTEVSQNLAVVRQSLETLAVVPAFVIVDKEKVVGEFVRLPDRNEVVQDINEAQIIEYYNRLL
ncbi:MAG: 30S ribosomal protein S4 [Bacilli bacterium]|jgi:small subunit ribosomal protein S4|nr:30S ribosomal protein S4 [Bacilli bacterium]MDD3388771.1 30S ribosomal protein S4 [Bacilli bacterium]MDD4344561.1 30S ribosomal protein S4 [Bacilli bacterium]MDD4520455.1 30S ribosomal protein S4 [Bacilli bacterium]MDY0399130.1 30S ribosomal protein S4 [Bacilli bacterium]